MAETKKSNELKTETKSEAKAPSAPPVVPVTPPTLSPAPTPPATLPTTPPTPTTPPAPSTAPTEAKKPVWPWILGGCLILLVLALAGIGILGWLGIQSAKNMIQKYEPTINQTQKTIDSVSQEASKWQETSQQMRDSLPNPEDLQKMQAGLPSQEDMQGVQGMPDFQKASP